MKPIESVNRDVAIIVDACLAEGPVTSAEIMALTTSMGYVPERQVDANALYKFTNTFLTHSRLLRHFRPPQIECPLGLWWPSETTEENAAGTAIWSRLAQAGVSQSAIKGSHYSIMRGSSARTLATEIELAITNAESPLKV